MNNIFQNNIVWLIQKNIWTMSSNMVIPAYKEQVTNIVDSEKRKEQIIKLLWEWVIEWEYYNIEIHKQLITYDPFEYSKAIINNWDDIIIEKTFDTIIDRIIKMISLFTADYYELKELVINIIKKIKNKELLENVNKNRLREIVWIKEFEKLIKDE